MNIRQLKIEPRFETKESILLNQDLTLLQKKHALKAINLGFQITLLNSIYEAYIYKPFYNGVPNTCDELIEEVFEMYTNIKPHSIGFRTNKYNESLNNVDEQLCSKLHNKVQRWIKKQAS